jgi:hypothetical protein
LTYYCQAQIRFLLVLLSHPPPTPTNVRINPIAMLQLRQKLIT